jgi:hypothetical protein
MDIVITAMPTDAAERVRARPDARRIVVGPDGGGPCRHCLRLGEPGETLLLVTYQPFAGHSPYAVPSPVFVHADPCSRHAADELPAFVAAGGPRSIRAYDANHDLVDGDVVDGLEVEATAARLLKDDRVAYLHVHAAVEGCFTFRVDRRAAS